LKNGFHLLAGQKPRRGKILKGDSVSVVGAAHKKVTFYVHFVSNFMPFYLQSM